MTFDLSTAKPVDDQSFDLSTAKPVEEGFRPGAEIGGQVIAGFMDVVGLLAEPLEKLVPLGGVSITSEGLEFVGPSEFNRARAEGEIPFPGAATEKPTDIFGSAARTAGQTLAAGPILGRAAGLVSKPVQATTKLGRLKQFPRKITAQVGETFARAPVKTTAVETLFGASAGAGGFVAAKIVPDSDTAKFVGEIVGGTAPAFTPTGLAIRTAGGARNLVQVVKHPFTEIGGRRRAAARAQRATPLEQRELAATELDRPTTIDPETGKPVLSPAQRTSDPGLLSLERAVVESSEELTRQADNQIAHANEVIQRSLTELGEHPASAAVPILEAQRYLDNLLDTRMRIAAQRVDERIVELGPKISREQANIVAREEIEKALQAARAQETELFDAIPETTAVPFSRTQSAFESFVKELGQPQQSDIPSIAKRFLSQQSDEFFGKNVPKGFRSYETRIKEIRALQSKLRETARNARAGDRRNLNKARIADGLADSITEDLAKAAAGPEAANAISAAVGFSRNLNERFSQGTVAKILGRKVSGESIPAGLTLEQSIGVSGPKAREAMDDLVKAFDSPEAPGSGLLIDASQNYLRSRFMLAAVERGQVNVKSAQRFITQNEEILKRLPDLKSQLDDIVSSSRSLTLAQRQRQRVTFDDPRISKATMLIEKGPMETFRQISKLKPSDAVKETQQLINRVARDSTGEALAGLKAGFVEFIIANARGGARDVKGIPFVSGFSVRDALLDPGTRAAASRLFSKEELNRIGIVTRDLIRLENRRNVPLPPEGVIGDKPSKLLETIAGIAGAAVGRSQSRRLGVGGTVQIPGIMANRFRDLAKAGVKDPAGRLIQDSIEDETLFRELLMAPLEEGGTKLIRQSNRRLNAWAATVLAEYGGAFEDENSF